MRVFDYLKTQFVDIVEYADKSNKILVYKYQRPGDEIKNGAQLIVREGQVGAFVYQGELADIFQPGTHTLSPDNFPILSTIEGYKFGFRSPIKAELYFISTRQMVDNKWGTKNPIIKRDSELKFARVRAFGTYSFRIIDPALFMREVFGSLSKVMTYDIVVYLSSVIVESLSIALNESDLSIVDLSHRYRDMGQMIVEQANHRTRPLGIEITGVIVENVSLPDHVEGMIDEQSGLGLASSQMADYVQYQTVQAMRDAAKQTGGLAGIGAGASLGKVMGDQLMAKPDNTGSLVEKLRELKLLLDEGIITQEEFDQQKKKLLK